MLDISWLYNNKLIKSHPNIRIRIKEGYSSCTLTQVTEDMAGEYSCKAVSNMGTSITKAKLHVHGLIYTQIWHNIKVIFRYYCITELTGPERDAWLVKKAKMEEEKKAKEQVKLKPVKKEPKAKVSKADYLRQAMEQKYIYQKVLLIEIIQH